MPFPATSAIREEFYSLTFMLADIPDLITEAWTDGFFKWSLKDRGTATTCKWEATPQGISAKSPHPICFPFLPPPHPP